MSRCVLFECVEMLLKTKLFVQGVVKKVQTFVSLHEREAIDDFSLLAKFIFI